MDVIAGEYRATSKSTYQANTELEALTDDDTVPRIGRRSR